MTRLLTTDRSRQEGSHSASETDVSREGAVEGNAEGEA